MFLKTSKLFRRIGLRSSLRSGPKVMAALLVISMQAPIAYADATSVKVLPPSTGMYHSAFPGFGPAEDLVTSQHIDRFASTISGKRLTWAYFSDNWFDGIKFPRKAVDVIRENGSIPFIRIMARSNWKACTDRKYRLDKIISGNFDEKLRRYARDVRRVPGPLIIEFGTEVNGDWFPWSGYCNGGAKRDGYGSSKLADGPERFRDAYRHIIDLFREEGANNVTWVLHLNAGSAPEKPWNNYAAYYPGDDYIDWIGVSVYGAQTPTELRGWNPRFRDVLDDAYGEISAISRNKPIAVLELGVVENEGKANWIRDALRDLRGGRYPRVKAISWWHSNWKNDDGSWSYMRIDSSPSALAAYREGVANSFFVVTPVVSR